MIPRDRLEAIWTEAVRSVDGGEATRRALPDVVGARDELIVLGLGKAAHAMAASVEAFAGERVRAGVVVTKDGHGGDLGRLPVREAGHPVPDARSEAAAREALALAAGADPEAVLLVLLSGGTSALTACPAPGLTLETLAQTTEVLLGCGADIAEMNAVRKHLSGFSGGRLAQASRGRRTEVLVISDVPGDVLSVIGSGPCAADESTFREALDVLERYRVSRRVPGVALAHLNRGAAGDLPETPGPDDEVFARVRHTLVATNADARRAAAAAARERGLRAVDLGELLEGEASDQASALVARARAERGRGPVCLIAGGETTVTLGGDPGRGGRNQELALAAACVLTPDDSDLRLLAAGTDGTDGPTDAAGAFVDAGTVARGEAVGTVARQALDRHDANPFFEREGGLFVTGPTATNVMDLVLVEVS